MDRWARTALGDVLKIEHGYAFQGKYFDPAGPWILLTPKNFKASGGLNVTESRRKFYEGPVDRRFILNSGDVVVAMTDLKQDAPILGSAGLVPEGERYLHNQRIGKVAIRDEDRLDRRFVPWLLNSPLVRQAVRSSATGATVRHTAPARIESVAVALPPVRTQRRISAVLSAFDEVVAVNERRIDLLEDLARYLYREWFVRLRFPSDGNERQPLSSSDSLPADWRACTLGEIVQLRYGKGLPKRQRRPGRIPVVGSAGVIDTHDVPLVAGPGIVVGRKGNIGSVWWQAVPFFPIDTTYYVESELPLGYLYWVLRDAKFVNSHAAVPGLSREQANALPVIVPPEALMHRFGDIHNLLFARAELCRAAIARLTETRDLLLPRLVTGQLDISDIDLGVLTPPDPE